jgi:DNA-binding transcriptional LysR family regulator
MTQLDLNDVAIFVRVVNRAGFAKVARELNVPTSTISRAISRLEATLGAQLLSRTTRSVVPTPEGQAFFREVAPAVASLHHAARGVDGADRKARGRLRVTTANDIGATFLGEVVAGFSQRYPNVEVETLLTQRTVNLVEEGVDVALRAASRLPDSSLIAKKIGGLEQDLYASRAYVQAHGVPATVEALDDHACVLFRPKDGYATWTFHSRGDRKELTKRVRGRIGTDDFSFMRSAVLAGAGIGLIPRVIVTHDVEAGRLVRVLPQYSSEGATLFFVHAPAAAIPAKITLFRDFVIEAFARYGVTNG